MPHWWSVHWASIKVTSAQDQNKCVYTKWSFRLFRKAAEPILWMAKQFVCTEAKRRYFSRVLQRGTRDQYPLLPALAHGVRVTNTTLQGKQPFSAAEWAVFIPFPHYQALKVLWSKYTNQTDFFFHSLSTSKTSGHLLNSFLPCQAGRSQAKGSPGSGDDPSAEEGSVTASWVLTVKSSSSKF